MAVPGFLGASSTKSRLKKDSAFFQAENLQIDALAGVSQATPQHLSSGLRALRS